MLDRKKDETAWEPSPVLFVLLLEAETGRLASVPRSVLSTAVAAYRCGVGAPSRREAKGDLALGGLAMVIAELELVRSSATFNRPAAMFATVLITAALCVRRRLPLSALAVVLAVNVAHRVVLGHPVPALADPPNSFALASVWLISVYSVAAFAPPLRALVGLAAAGATTIAFSATCGCDPVVNDFLAAFLLSVAVPWLAGFARARHLASVDTQRLADQQRAERERAESEAVAAERGRIARELHDIVAHGLSVIVVQASAERRQLAPGETSSVLATIEDAGRSALTELRRLLGVLRATDDAPLEPQPRLQDLDHVVEAVQHAGVAASLRTEGPPRPLPPGIELSAYRVAQEALTNIVKHAGASHAEVTLRYSSGHLEVEVVDDGAIQHHSGPPGYGLVGARERVTLLGGTFSASRCEHGGFRVLARFPLVAPS